MTVSSSLISLVKRPKNRVFRRLEVKRRETTGEYETDWQVIPEYLIISYGSVSYGVSDVKINFNTYSGMDFKLYNDAGYFNDIEDPDSFFFNKLSIYRSLVRVSVGYYDDSDTEIPTNPIIYYGIIEEGFTRSDDNTVIMKTAHITKIFDEYPAKQIVGLGVTQTADEVMQKIRDNVDTNGELIFQKYITASAWIIESTTRYYWPNTLTGISEISTWEMMRRLSEAENKQLFVNQSGQFNFIDNTPGSTSVYHFSGSNDEDSSYGKNIIGPVTLDDRVKDVYNWIRIKFDGADTYTSYYNKVENWSWGDSSSSFKYGQRKYEVENGWLDENTAAEIADIIFDKYSEPLAQLKFKAKIIPGLEINDRVSISHLTGIIRENAYYGVGLYDTGIYSKYKNGSVNINDVEFSVKNITFNVDDYTMNVTLEEIA